VQIPETPFDKLEAVKPQGVLQVSNDGDDRMGAKIKTQKKSLGLPTKPQKIPGTKINLQKIPCRISEPEKIPERLK